MPNFLDRLTIPEESGLDPTMLVPLLRLLAAGEPVTVEALAAAVVAMRVPTASRVPSGPRAALAAIRLMAQNGPRKKQE